MPSVAFADVMNKLDEGQRHVIRERLAGRTHRAIARDGIPGRQGSRITFQAVERRERAALRVLGCQTSIADAVHAAERFDRAIELQERAQRVFMTELSADPKLVAARRYKYKRTAADKLEDLATRLLNEVCEGGTLSAERRAWYEQQGIRLRGR